MKQCPNSYLAGVWMLVQWWLDWRRFKSLPYGGTDVMSQPQFVVEVIRTCEDTLAEIHTKTRAKSEAEQKKILDELRRSGRVR